MRYRGLLPIFNGLSQHYPLLGCTTVLKKWGWNPTAVLASSPTASAGCRHRTISSRRTRPQRQLRCRNDNRWMCLKL
jgi:hypothetical protein